MKKWLIVFIVFFNVSFTFADDNSPLFSLPLAAIQPNSDPVGKGRLDIYEDSEGLDLHFILNEKVLFTGKYRDGILRQDGMDWLYVFAKHAFYTNAIVKFWEENGAIPEEMSGLLQNPDMGLAFTTATQITEAEEIRFYIVIKPLPAKPEKIYFLLDDNAIRHLKKFLTDYNRQE